MSNPDAPLLQIMDVYKAYGDKVILDNVDLNVRAGELCTLVGPSGAGKSTLLRLVLGQEFPSQGQLLLDGQRVLAADVPRPGGQPRQARTLHADAAEGRVADPGPRPVGLHLCVAGEVVVPQGGGLPLPAQPHRQRR